MVFNSYSGNFKSMFARRGSFGLSHGADFGFAADKEEKYILWISFILGSFRYFAAYLLQVLHFDDIVYYFQLDVVSMRWEVSYSRLALTGILA